MSVTLLVALYCLEAGLFFLVVPWTRVWTLNSLLHGHSTLAILAANPYVRGFISGLGVVHILVGIRDILRIHARRREEKAG